MLNLNVFSRKKPANPNFVLGFPKTGNTWFRFLLGRYMQLLTDADGFPLLEPCDFDRNIFRAQGANLTLATHGPLTWGDQTAADLTFDNTVGPFLETKTVLLIRHPLDTCLSHYMHNMHRTNLKRFDTLAEFCNDPVFGIEKFVRFYALWSKHLSDKNVLLVRYEGMKSNIKQVAEIAFAFLGLPLIPEKIDASIAFSSFENMKKLQAGEPINYRSSGFPVFGRTNLENPNAQHIRDGKIGAYRESLSDCEQRRFEAMFSSRLSVYGYGSVDAPASASG